MHSYRGFDFIAKAERKWWSKGGRARRLSTRRRRMETAVGSILFKSFSCEMKSPTDQERMGMMVIDDDNDDDNDDDDGETRMRSRRRHVEQS